MAGNKPDDCDKFFKEIQDEYGNFTSEEIIEDMNAKGYQNITSLYNRWGGTEADRKHGLLTSLANYKYDICKEKINKELNTKPNQNKKGGKRRRNRSRRNRRSNRRRTTRK